MQKQESPKDTKKYPYSKPELKVIHPDLQIKAYLSSAPPDDPGWSVPVYPINLKG